MKRRWAAAGILAIAVAAFVVWRTAEHNPPAPAAPPSPATPAVTREPWHAMAQVRKQPPIQLEKPVMVRSAPAAVPGTLDGTVIDAETDGGIAGAVLTFSHDNGAYETASGEGGYFLFKPSGPGVYRLVALEANGYVPFQREFGQSPVSFTSIAGKDVGGVVLRLVRERKSGRSAHAGRERDGRPDGGGLDSSRASGALRGRVFDARTGAPVAAFAVALSRREGIRYPEEAGAASFIDPSGAYEIADLVPGTYEATAMAAGYAASRYALIQIADAPVEADFALHAGVRVSGVVRDAANDGPIGGAAVTLEGRRGDAPDLPAAPLSPEIRTGSDGRFALEHVPSDAIGLRFEKDGYLSRLVSLGAMGEEGDTPPVSIRLTRREPGADARVELTGIGATLRATADALEIRQLMPSAGAAEAGLLRGDQIVAIDGVPVENLGFEQAIGAIRGTEGTTVMLRIRRAGRESDVIVTRKLVRR